MVFKISHTYEARNDSETTLLAQLFGILELY